MARRVATGSASSRATTGACSTCWRPATSNASTRTGGARSAGGRAAIARLPMWSHTWPRCEPCWRAGIRARARSSSSCARSRSGSATKCRALPPARLFHLEFEDQELSDEMLAFGSSRQRARRRATPTARARLRVRLQAGATKPAPARAAGRERLRGNQARHEPARLDRDLPCRLTYTAPRPDLQRARHCPASPSTACVLLLRLARPVPDARHSARIRTTHFPPLPTTAIRPLLSPPRYARCCCATRAKPRQQLSHSPDSRSSRERAGVRIHSRPPLESKG